MQPVEEEEVPDEPIDIEEEDIPLAVVDDEKEDDDDNAGEEKESTGTETEIEIEEEDLPLVAPVAEAAGRIWWSWIPVVGAVASAVETYRQNKKEKKESGDSRKTE